MMKYLSDIDKLAPTEVKKLQEKKLKKLLIYLEKKSPFYQELFQRNKINISKIRSTEDLIKIPLTGKDELQARSKDFLCVDKNEIIEYCSTSGTMGSPLIIALTEKDLERLAYNEYLSFLCAGGTENDIFQLMLTLDRQFMAGIAYYFGARKIGAGIIRVGPGNFAMQMDTIQRICPSILVAVPSLIIKLINDAAEKNIILNNTTIKKII